MRATIAIDGYDQILEIDSSVEEASTVAGTVSLSLSRARIFPSEPLRDDYRDAGEGI